MSKFLSAEEKRDLQLDELTILEELDRICKKHNIEYFLTAGTLLGAVRHRGFIPWDDDIDLVMKKSEFKRFRKIAETELSEGFFYQDEKTEKEYCFAFAKVRKEGKKVYEPNLKSIDIHKGVYIDIFPLDNCPKSDRAANAFFKLVRLYSVALIAKQDKDFVCEYDKKSARAMFNFIKIFPLGFIKFLRGFTIKLVALFTSGKRLCTVSGTHGYPKETYDAEWFSKAEFMEFENREYPVPSGWKSILTNMYGDYTIPPDENARTGHFEKDI